MNAILIKGAEVYAPKYIGKKDIFIVDKKIVKVAENINAPSIFNCTVIDADGLTAIPGFIDSHVHIAGAGGEGGPATRTPELPLSKYIEAGVTTVIGCLGTDGMTRNVESVLMRAKALRNEGISAWIYTGAYQVPTPTITGDVGKDIALIDEIIGVGEIALSDHRSSWPSPYELLRLTEHARVGGMLGGKAGIVNIHLGDQYNPFQPLYEVIELSKNMLKLTQFLPTHCNRNDYTFDSAIEYLKKGGYIDITTSSYPYFPEYEVKPSKCLKILIDNNIGIDNVTFSSDAGGSLPGFDDKGNLIKLEMGLPFANFKEIIDAVKEEKIPLEEALKVVTVNPARILKLHNKGKIEESYDADIILIDNFSIHSVIANGVFLMKERRLVKKGNYE
ncbi:MAG: beta-aspartyl-peptidase [Bacteroidales bacterium]|nr:beta-aspartyl-peptidase [Bacteroidales bacterium]